MPNNICTPKFEDKSDVTCRASADVIGKRFVKLTANATDGNPKVGPCTAGARAFGVAGYDAPSGSTLPVKRQGIVPVKAGANLSAGTEVTSDSTGQAVAYTPPVATNGQALPATPRAAGQVVFDATSGNDVLIDLY